VIRTSLRRAVLTSATALTLGLGLVACGGQDEGTTGGSEGEDVSGSVVSDGSSTVEPLTTAASELFSEEQPDVKVAVSASGTGGGFEAFCAGKTDISNASRPIDEEEAAICEDAGIEFTELRVATDALTVVANPEVPVDCVTTEQLATIWGPDAEGKIDNWNQVDPSFPDMPLNLFGPGTDSGTFDYFTDVINGEEGVSRSDYEASEDDNVLVDGVANTEGAMGYFGFSFYEQNSDKLKALEIDSGGGCIAPSAETAASGEYTPLARPLFIYVANQSYEEKPQVATFVDFYVANLPQIAEAALYIPLNDEQLGETESVLSQMQ